MSKNRRQFIKTAGVATLGVAGALATGKVIADNKSPKTLGALTKHQLPTLPYAYNALLPFIDEATMKLHHGKHHRAYVNGLNQAELELAKARASNDFHLVEFWSKKVAFNSGGHFLHSMFWETMAPSQNGPLKGIGGGTPKGDLAKKISEDFGNFDSFKKHFTEAAASVEGSGWALLQLRRSDNRLLILQAENQHKLSTWESIPILGIDVWEHAYYLKYFNQRKEYIEAWWNLVNWPKVSELFKKTQNH